ncbi:sigma factor-like helix-turn-helix DNA-binding protein [Streptomyces sp. NPDC058545]|uniref:sigma factor-like helix-turn-helix DNA-binding protein n=1 Tax=Streptomyces sp. NPDC058545 TaxID=3346544 RepID=UPI00364F2D47
MTPHLMIEQLKSVVPERIGMIRDEDPAARAARQRAEDAALVERLRLAHFEGPEMELARERLWAYAVVTLNAWCASGTIVERVRASSEFHGRFEMQDRHSDVLRADPEERIDLTLSAVAGAWPSFLEYGLRGGKWDPNWEPETAVADSRSSSAAGLRTYFTKGVLQYFPREYWKWATAQDLRLTELGVLDDWTVRLEPWWPGASHFEDEDVVVNDWLNRLLTSLPPQTRHIFRMVYEGHTYAEIGEVLGITAKVVADRIYRARQRLTTARESLRQTMSATHSFIPQGPDDRMASALHQRAREARKASIRR